MANISQCIVAPVVLQGANTSIQVCGLETPVDKVDLKLHAKKTEVTSTASYVAGTVWEEYAPGSSGGSCSWDGHWRVSQFINPPDMIPGKTYPAKVYVRRAGSNGPNDPGMFYAFNIMIESGDLGFDPKAGVITWKVSAAVTGQIVYPIPS